MMTELISLLERCENVVVLDRFIWTDNRSVFLLYDLFARREFIKVLRTYLHHLIDNIEIIIDENR